MTCPHCGYESTQPNTHCPSCGNTFAAPQPAVIGPNPMENVLFPLLRDPLFLIVCILTSVAAGLSFVLSDGVPVLEVLFTVFLWITYAAASKNELSIKGLRGVSGTLYAVYVLQMIAAIFVIVIGALCIPSAFVISNNYEYAQGLFETAEIENFIIEWIAGASKTTALLLMIALGVLCIIIGLVQLLFCLKGWRPIHRFAQSLYKSIELGTVDVRFADEAQLWLMVLGIFRGVSAASFVIRFDFTSFILTGATAALLILGSVLLKKYKHQNN